MGGNAKEAIAEIKNLLGKDIIAAMDLKTKEVFNGEIEEKIENFADKIKSSV